MYVHSIYLHPRSQTLASPFACVFNFDCLFRFNIIPEKIVKIKNAQAMGKAWNRGYDGPTTTTTNTVDLLDA